MKIILKENDLKNMINSCIKKILYETANNQSNFNPNMPIEIIGGPLEGEYVAQDIVDNFELNGYIERSSNPRYANSPIVDYPKIKGYVGPMWDGDHIRYESQEANDIFSK